MVDLSKIDKVFLFPGITDMRLGINGLRNNIPDIENDCLYVFCNKTKTSIKIIEVNDYGCWLYQRKLFKGKFMWPSEGEETAVDKEQINWIINGISLVLKIENSGQKLVHKLY